MAKQRGLCGREFRRQRLHEGAVFKFADETVFLTNQGSVSMLVLTRKYQEKIRIGDNITITVLRTKGKAVRLGIEAPANVPVIRGELSFEHESEEAAEPAATVSFDELAPVKQRLACAGGMAAATRWATSQDSEPKVSLSRVSRSKVVGLVPKLVSSDAPLRSMMDQAAKR
jgi:carbon storage regulator